MKDDPMVVRFSIYFFASLVTTYVLATLYSVADISTLKPALMGATWVWLGFVATTSLGGVLWERKPLKLYTLNNGYELLSLVVAGMLLVPL